MQHVVTWRRQFNWRMLLMRIVVNALVLLITVGLVPDIYFVNRSVVVWIGLSIILGILNAIVKPLIQFATLRFIFATYGLVLVVINTILLLLMAWLFPNYFEVASFFWALVGGAVIGISSAVLESLLGVSPPIVSEKFPELRERLKNREAGSMEAIITQAAVGDKRQVEDSPAEETSQAAAAAAVLAIVGDDGIMPAVQDQAETQTTASTGQEA